MTASAQAQTAVGSDGGDETRYSLGGPAGAGNLDDGQRRGAKNRKFSGMQRIALFVWGGGPAGPKIEMTASAETPKTVWS